MVAVTSVQNDVTASPVSVEPETLPTNLPAAFPAEVAQNQTPDLRSNVVDLIGGTMDEIRNSWIEHENNKTALSPFVGDEEISKTYELYLDKFADLHLQLIGREIEPSVALSKYKEIYKEFNIQIGEDFEQKIRLAEQGADVSKFLRDLSVLAVSGVLTTAGQNGLTGGWVFAQLLNQISDFVDDSSVDPSVGRVIKRGFDDFLKALSGQQGELIFAQAGKAATVLGFDPLAVGALASAASGSAQAGINIV